MFKKMFRQARPVNLSRRVRARLSLESLESREVPASLVVTTLNDENDPNDGQLSLREAIVGVNASNDATNTITFASGLTGTINVGTGGAGAVELPAITKAVTITGPGANLLTVKDNVNNSDAFDVNAGAGTLVSISGLTVSGNLTGNNGGVRNEGSTVTLTNLELTGNSNTNNGGAVIHTAGVTNLVGCTIAGNTAGTTALGKSGGGVQVSAGTVNIDQCTIAGNTAVRSGANGNGGGINVDGGTVRIRNSTITGNSAGGAGGGISVAAGATVTLSSTIVAGNTGALNGNNDVSGAVSVTSDSNLIGNPAGLTTNLAGANNNQVGTAAMNINPMLGNLANNGGPTRTVLPQAGSPAIGKGVANGFTTDQRGFSPRAVNGAADVGAVQVAATASGPGTGQAAGGSPTGPASGTPTGSGSGSNMQKDQRAAINQLIIANYQRIFAQPLPPALAFAMISQIADVNGDGFADVTCLIGVKAGKKVQVFKIVFDGLSPSGATLGGITSLGTF